VFLWLGIYEDINRQGVSFFKRIFAVTAILAMASYVVRSSLDLESWPRSLAVLYFSFSFLGFLAWRLFFSRTFKTFLSVRGIPVIVYGAGEAGRLFARQQRVRHDYFVSCFIDDDPEKHDTDIDGIKVYPVEDAATLMEMLSPAFILLALPSVPKTTRRSIISMLAAQNIPMQTLSQKAVIDTDRSINSMEDISYEDLIGGAPMDSAMLNDIRQFLAGQVVLVTGAGGTIGSALCESLIRLGVDKIIALDQSELGLYNLSSKVSEILEFLDKRAQLITCMGSVSSRESVRQILRKHGVNLVLHAAAYKHVGLVEKNIESGIENNVIGTEILLEEIVTAPTVRKFVLVSSDKAVRPTNVMGATKRLAELLVMRAAKKYSSTQFGIVRFGNVIGSSGSVVPKFLRQIKNGRDITVSHPEVIRYFMTSGEAADLILLCALISRHGEVYLLDMGAPIKIVDLAMQLVNSCGRRVSENTDISSSKIVFSGLGAGEKMYEELLINDGNRHEYYTRVFLGNEDQVEWRSFDSDYDALKLARKGCSNWSLDDKELKVLLQRLVSEYQLSG
jgi:FlaA1/EpsC-like NDP-sugar epimerase